MKKQKFLLSLAILGCSATSLGAAIALRSQATTPIFAEDATINITTEAGINENIIALNVDTTLPAIATHDITWYVNGEPYLASVYQQAAGGTSIMITWNGSDPTKSFGKCDARSGDEAKQYCHYRVPAGTVIADGITLENDYNFWFTHQSAGADNHTWMFQHGGASAGWNHEVPSIHISGVNAYVFNQAGNADRVLLNFSFEKQAGVRTNGSWNAAHYLYAKQGEEDYTLVDQTSATAGDIVYGMDGNMSNADATSGTWGLLLFYSGFGRTTGSADDGTARSFYIPKGSLYGGFNEGYGFFIDNDVYLDYNGDNTFTNAIFDARHTYEKVEAKAATCTEAGNIEYYTCPRHSNEYFVLEDGTYNATTATDVTLPALGHTYEKVEAKAKTCTEDGNIEYYKCSVCGKYFVLKDGTYTETTAEGVVIPASHEYVKVEAKAKTCTEDGYKEHYKCSDCGKLFVLNGTTYEETTEEALKIPASHEYQKVEAKAKTCTEDGNIEYYKCSDCGKLFVLEDGVYTETTADAVVIPASHNYQKVEAKAKTCTEDGCIEHYVCSDCGKLFVLKDGAYTEVEEKDVVIPASHEYEKVEAKAKTCTEDGNIEYYKCAVCGKYFTLNEDGTYTEVSADDIVVPASHEYVKIEAKAKTCTEDGNIEYYKCAVCGKYFTLNEDGTYTEVSADDVIIPASHEYEKAAAKAATCTEDGNIEYYKCAVCGKYFTLKDGVYTEVEAKDLVVAALGHDFGEWTAYKKDDGTYAIRRTCARCGEVETVDATEANGFTIEVTRKATTTEEGEVSLKSDKYGTFTLPIEKLQPTEPAESGLSGGAIAGIVVGSVVLVAAAAALTIVLVRKKGKAK